MHLLFAAPKSAFGLLQQGEMERTEIHHVAAIQD